MPYIEQDDRKFYDRYISILPRARDSGILNYILTKVVLQFIGSEWKYEDLNAAVGALECCKQELYRRMAAPYEDIKIKRNGDVY